MVDIAEPEVDQPKITFDQFREEWVQEIVEGNPGPFEKGRRFAAKLVMEWLNVSDDDDSKLVFCDGSGDGGIDVAYLWTSDIDEGEQDNSSAEGDTWYLVQSKYGTAFQGHATVIEEGRKVIATLCGENQRLSQNVRDLMEQLTLFREKASERDRIVLVFATEMLMSEADRQALDDVRVIGRERLTNLFDVLDVSLYNLWDVDPPDEPNLSLTLKGNFVDVDSSLRVGTVSLTNLYGFLKSYRDKTGDLDQLYERNVRRWLGGKGKVNTGIEGTLLRDPEMFGLYNNGITIVVSDFQRVSDDVLSVCDPFVVNGCQTTKTIWNVLSRKLESGGTGRSSTLEDWEGRAKQGVVVTKIVKSGSAQIDAITQFTNSQNAVRAQDFIALRPNFRRWAEDMATNYGISLEIQRGGWDSQKAYQRNHPSARQFVEWAKAFDLIKVIGAGWQQEPGLAFNKNAPFLENGTVFKAITIRQEGELPFGTKDFYAAYKLKSIADEFDFGRKGSATRRQTRFLFYYIAVRLLRDILVMKQLPANDGGVTAALVGLIENGHENTLSRLANEAVRAVDEYLTLGGEYSVHKEPAYNERFNQDMNGFLKWDRLTKGDHTPVLRMLLGNYERDTRRPIGDLPSLANAVAAALQS